MPGRARARESAPWAGRRTLEKRVADRVGGALLAQPRVQQVAHRRRSAALGGEVLQMQILQTLQPQRARQQRPPLLHARHREPSQQRGLLRGVAMVEDDGDALSRLQQPPQLVKIPSRRLLGLCLLLVAHLGRRGARAARPT